MSSLDDKILNVLNDKGLATAKDIFRILNGEYTKKEINHSLYKNLSDKVFSTNTDSSALPIWTLKNFIREIDESSDKKQEKLVVMIDLGNIHDCLKMCEGYTNQFIIDETYAFADYHYNGYGVGEKVKTNRVYVQQAQYACKNAAETLLIWKVFNLIWKNDCMYNFVIVTKDEGFRYLEQIVKENGHKITFVKNKEDLKIEIE